MPEPIITRESKCVAWEHPQRHWSYDEILELFPDGDDSLVNPLVRRCQKYEAQIREWRVAFAELENERAYLAKKCLEYEVQIQRMKESLEKIANRDFGVNATRTIAGQELDFKEENV